MALLGSGNWLPSTFPRRYRLWISITLRNTSGKWLVPSMDRRLRPLRFGPKTPAICLYTATLKNSPQPSLLCPPLPLRLGKAAVCLRKLLTTLLPTLSACVIRLFAHKGCMWAVASLKPLVRRLWLLASSALVCVGPLAAWMRFCLCALPFSTAPMTLSGRANLVSSLDLPQLIHTHHTGKAFLDFLHNEYTVTRCESICERTILYSIIQ